MTTTLLSTTNTSLLFLILIHITIQTTNASTTTRTQERNNLSSSKTYSNKYQHYPKYCSFQDEMRKRTIPPLDITSPTQILQVNAIVRHGTRTLSSPTDEKGGGCWDTYFDPDSDTSTWNCNLQPILIPPQRQQTSSNSSSLVFSKRYDALSAPLSNALNGNCSLGQLLQDGYDQEHINGQRLRDAYMSPKKKSMHLFVGLKDNEAIMKEPYTFIRSDDMERTLMSGQILFRGLFGRTFSSDEMVTVHTADYGSDIMSANYEQCPLLRNLEDEARNAPEFTEKMKSTQNLMKLWKGKLHANETRIVDCLMTTICTDRTLPDAVNDFDGEENGDSVFSQLIRYNTWIQNFIYQYKSGQFSKVAMGPLWAEIVEKIGLTSERKRVRDVGAQTPRFVLYSGHDSTIMPLLASLGAKDMDWTPYASMLIIEIHAILDKQKTTTISDRAFRLIYNGQVITELVKGCEESQHLCNVQILLDAVEPFATRTNDHCDIPNLFSSPQKSTKPKEQNPVLIASLAVLSALIGSVFTFLYMMYIADNSMVQYDVAATDGEATNYHREEEGEHVGKEVPPPQGALFDLADSFKDGKLDHDMETDEHDEKDYEMVML